MLFNAFMILLHEFQRQGICLNCNLHLVLLVACVFFVKLYRIGKLIVRYIFLPVKDLLGSFFWVLFTQLKIMTHPDKASYHHLLYQSQI